MSQPQHAEALDKFFTPTMSSSSSEDKVISFPGAKENSLLKTVGMMALQGLSCNEIAHILDKDVELVEQIYQDPAIQSLFAREIEAKGKFALKKLVSGAAIDVVCVLRSIVLNGAAKHSDRIAAGRELLDRGFGKPVPASKKETEDDGWIGADPEATLEKLRAELAHKLENIKRNNEAKQHQQSKTAP